jgi:quinol monooxygenase YgiN
MATALSHIRVRPGMEAEFEEIAAELYRATHAEETAVGRYEYWRGAEPGSYYCLLSFDDFLGFLTHQSSDHHSAASPRLHEVTESMTLEWLDPVPAASPLAPTDVMPLPADATELEATYHRRFADIAQPWWLPLR